MAQFIPSGRRRRIRFTQRILLTGFALLAAFQTVTARAALDTGNPLEFFTRLANGLLRNTFSFGVTNIPVYVHGQFVYTPSVQRLLQLSANIYDATTNRTADLRRNYPSVFRPLFSVTTAGDLYITGFTNVATVTGADDLVFSAPFDAATLAAAGPSTNVAVNVYDVPWIIGAKKGFPAFNQFAMLNAVEVTRKLMVSKPYFGAALSQFVTNQMYVFSISNSLGCSFWNASTNDYTNADFTLVANDRLSMVLTNGSGDELAEFQNVPVQTRFQTNFWPGTIWATVPPITSLAANGSFIWLLNVTAVLLPNSIYRFADGVTVTNPFFDSTNLAYQTTISTPALPTLGLVTTNRLQAFILDGHQVIDYVQFAGPEGGRNLNAELADPAISTGNSLYLWSTNPFSATDPFGTSWGVVNQVLVSLGQAPPIPNIPQFWQVPPNLPAYLPKTPAAEQAFLKGFFNVNPIIYGTFIFNGARYTNTALAVQAPYTPTRMLYNLDLWQANDPLVHFLASDLQISWPGLTGINKRDDPNSFLPAINLASLPRSWSPWGVKLYSASVPPFLDTTFTSSLKDPLVWRPDDWNFPTGQDWSLSALGRVHRGTPWQTLYLKATDILADPSGNGPATWARWVGDPDPNDAQVMAPVNDQPLLGVILPLLNTNDPTQLLSVNDPSLARWLTSLDGLLVCSNSGPDIIGYSAAPPLDYSMMSSNSPQALQIAEAIAQQCSSQPGKIFPSVGALLSVAALAENSPWLNTTSINQQHYSISDAAYEAIPSQLLPRLRPDSFGALHNSGGAWNVTFTGADGYTYVLQSSTNLVNWETVSTNCPCGGSFTVRRPAPSAPQEFFRSVLPP